MGENKLIQSKSYNAVEVVLIIRNNIVNNLIIWKNNHSEELLYKNVNELIDELAEMIRWGDI